MAFELRAAGPQDGDALAAVFGAARRSALAYLPQLHSAAEDRAHFAGEIAHGGTTVAVQDGRVVAFIALREARVAHLYVDPEHWRHAIGGALLPARRPSGRAAWTCGSFSATQSRSRSTSVTGFASPS